MRPYNKIISLGLKFRHSRWGALILLLVAVSQASCLKSTYREAVCAFEVEITYDLAHGVEAVDGTLKLLDINTRTTYKTSVVGTTPVRMEVPRGFYSVQFEGVARSNGKIARVVAVVEEQPIVKGQLKVTLKPLSQWL